GDSGGIVKATIQTICDPNGIPQVDPCRKFRGNTVATCRGNGQELDIIDFKTPNFIAKGVGVPNRRTHLEPIGHIKEIVQVCDEGKSGNVPGIPDGKTGMDPSIEFLCFDTAQSKKYGKGK